MPLGYHINPDEGLITLQGTGEVPVAEFTRVCRAMLEDRNYDPDLPQLVDLRGLRPAPLQADGSALPGLESLRAFVQEDFGPRVNADVAVVIDDHLEERHCADIFLLTCAVHEAELFADYDQALRWLMRRAFAAVPPPGRSTEQEDAGGDDAEGAPE